MSTSGTSVHRLHAVAGELRAPALKGTNAALAALTIVAALHLLALVIVGAGLYVTGHAVAGGHARPADALPAAAALLVLLTLRPRGHTFVKPGPRMIRGEQPDLFAVLDDATKTVGVAPYDEVYVDGSANGRIVQRDGLFGFGGERTLVVGAALLRTMTIDHLKALVAYEAVRYHSPDSKLAALVERTRARMRSGLDELATGSGGGLTSVPFQLWAGFFLRRTDRLSAAFRLATDDLVADRIGALQMTEMLKMTSGLPAVLEAYGKVYAGPNGTPFEEFVVSDEAARTFSFARFRQSEAATAGEPAVDERLLRLQGAPRESHPFDERPAAGLIRSFGALSARQMADRFALRHPG